VGERGGGTENQRTRCMVVISTHDINGGRFKADTMLAIESAAVRAFFSRGQ